MRSSTQQTVENRGGEVGRWCGRGTMECQADQPVDAIGSVVRGESEAALVPCGAPEKAGNGAAPQAPLTPLSSVILQRFTDQRRNCYANRAVRVGCCFARWLLLCCDWPAASAAAAAKPRQAAARGVRANMPPCWTAVQVGCLTESLAANHTATYQPNHSLAARLQGDQDAQTALRLASEPPPHGCPAGVPCSAPACEECCPN